MGSSGAAERATAEVGGDTVFSSSGISHGGRPSSSSSAMGSAVDSGSAARGASSVGSGEITGISSVMGSAVDSGAAARGASSAGSDEITGISSVISSVRAVARRPAFMAAFFSVSSSACS